MNSKGSAVLAVKNIKKQFKNRDRKQIIAVDGVSFTISPGEIFGLIGASGSGKSTLIKLIFGIEKADIGEVFLNDVPFLEACSRSKNKLRKKMGLVLQDPYNSLCPRFTVKDILAEPLIMHKKMSNKHEALVAIKKMLKQVELDTVVYLDRFPHQLSGGERQRVALARALMLEPEFLALDEPTSMLDEKTKVEIVALIKKMVKTMNLGVLLVTHDLGMAATTCHTIAVMKHGKIIEIGGKDKIVHRPEHIYTKKLFLASTDLKKYWEFEEKHRVLKEQKKRC